MSCKTILYSAEDVPMRNETSRLNIRNFANTVFSLQPTERKLVRKLEKVQLRINAAETAVLFNRTCIREGLLPRYSNVRLHEPHAANDRHTQAFRRRLVERQLREKQEEEKAARATAENIKRQWRSLQDGDRAHVVNALQLVIEDDRRRREDTILRKLIKLNGGKLRLPQRQQNFLNLTQYQPDEDEEALLQLGLNCHFTDKPQPMQKRLEIEVLLDQLLTLKKGNKVKLSDSLRPLLLAEALTQCCPARHTTLMSRKLWEAAKN